MTTIKKNVHRTGALASILNQSNIQPVNIVSNKKVPDIYQSNLNEFQPSNNKQLNEKKFDVLIELTPDSCKPWNFSDRLDLEMGNINELANSIQQAGQQEPILVRPVDLTIENSTSDQKYEIIFGNRRWRACKQIGRNVLAIIRNISDQEAALAQKEENENRENISDYSRAINYKKLIESGVFSNENQLAMKLNIPRNRLNDLMSYNRIPKELLQLMPNAYNISQRLAIKLATLTKNPTVLKILLCLAPQINAGKITSTNIDKIIKQHELGTSVLPTKRNSPVLGKGGAEIFTMREDSNGAPCIVLHKISRQAVNLDELRVFLKNYIDKCIEENFNKNLL